MIENFLNDFIKNNLSKIFLFFSGFIVIVLIFYQHEKIIDLESIIQMQKKEISLYKERIKELNDINAKLQKRIDYEIQKCNFEKRNILEKNNLLKNFNKIDKNISIKVQSKKTKEIHHLVPNEIGEYKIIIK